MGAAKSSHRMDVKVIEGQYSNGQRTLLSNRLTSNSLQSDRHRSLKRWEKMAQAKSWRQRDGEHDTPTLPCPWKREPDPEIRFRPGHLLALYLGDFALIRYAPADAGDSGVFLIRAGIPWELWYPRLFDQYQRGIAVPKPFQPRRKLPALWVENAKHWSPRLQGQWFTRLRESGLLPPLPPLESATVLPWLRWEEMKARFLDFKDNARPRS